MISYLQPRVEVGLIEYMLLTLNANTFLIVRIDVGQRIHRIWQKFEVFCNEKNPKK